MRLFLLIILLPSISLAGNAGKDCGLHKKNPFEGMSYIQEIICKNAISSGVKENIKAACKNTNASINGEDNRFTREENTEAFLDDAFKFTGRLYSDDGQCRYSGSGFINEGKLTTARHVVCGLIEYKCDLSKVKMKTQNKTYSLKPVLPNSVDCSNPKDMLVLDLKSDDPPEGIETVTKKEAIEIFKAIKKANKGLEKFPRCHVLGRHSDTKIVQSSFIKHAKMRLRKNIRVIENCSDTISGSSGGPLVCNVNGKPKVLGVNSFGSSYENGSERVQSCGQDSLNRNGNASIFFYKDS